MYKEGQGKWARGSLAVILAGVGLYATVSVSGWLEGNDWGSGVLFTIPVVSWALKTQDVLSVLVFMPFLLAGYKYYNNPRTSDFLIETESELQNKVTWPTWPETAKNSVVVVVTCLLIMGWVALANGAFQKIQQLVYHG